MRNLITFVFLAALAGCSQPSATAPAAAGPTPFTIDLTFSDAAQAKLSELGEAVIVSAYYYGEPKPGIDTGDAPVVTLGSEETEIAPAAQSVALAGGWDQALAKDIQGAPMVNVNVFSARKSGPDNLLDCGLLEDALATVAARANQLHCKLIGE